MSTSFLGRSAGTSSKARSRFGYVKAMLVFLMLAAAFLFLSVTSFSDLSKQAGFASVQGQVVGVEEEEEERKQRKKRTRIECSLVVSYTVAGQSYTARGLDDGPCAKRPGEAMTVRYNPSLPGLATLERASDQRLWAWGGAAGAVLCGIVAPAAITAQAISRRRKRRAAAAGTA